MRVYSHDGVAVPGSGGVRVAPALYMLHNLPCVEVVNADGAVLGARQHRGLTVAQGAE